MTACASSAGLRLVARDRCGTRRPSVLDAARALEVSRRVAPCACSVTAPASSDMPRSSSGVPLATMRPRSMMIARVQAASTSSRMWVEKTIALFLPELADEVAHLVLLVRVEAVGRLVHDQHFRVVDQRLREAGAVPVALRERVDRLVQHRSRGSTARPRGAPPSCARRRAGRASRRRSRGSRAPSCPDRRRRSRAGSRSAASPRAATSTTSWPPTVTLPAVGGMKPVIMRMVVDLPAPLGPRKPSTSPRSTVNEMPSTARLAPNVLTRLSMRIMGFVAEIPGATANVGSPGSSFKGADYRPERRIAIRRIEEAA